MHPHESVDGAIASGSGDGGERREDMCLSRIREAVEQTGWKGKGKKVGKAYARINRLIVEMAEGKVIGSTFCNRLIN